jgi:hypothetical protein
VIAAIEAPRELEEEGPPIAKRKPSSEIQKVFKEIHKALENLETWVTAAQAELADWLRAHAREPKGRRGANR